MLSQALRHARAPAVVSRGQKIDALAAKLTLRTGPDIRDSKKFIDAGRVGDIERCTFFIRDRENAALPRQSVPVGDIHRMETVYVSANAFIDDKFSQRSRLLSNNAGPHYNPKFDRFIFRCANFVRRTDPGDATKFWTIHKSCNRRCLPCACKPLQLLSKPP